MRLTNAELVCECKWARDKRGRMGRERGGGGGGLTNAELVNELDRLECCALAFEAIEAIAQTSWWLERQCTSPTKERRGTRASKEEIRDV